MVLKDSSLEILNTLHLQCQRISQQEINKKKMASREISHSSDCEEYSLLGCNIVCGLVEV
jgi:hypothetical protein